MNFRYSKTLIPPMNQLSKICSMAWSPNNMRLAVACADRKIYLFNEQGDGKLTKDELKNALLNFVTEDYLNNIDDIFIILDGDRDGFIDYEEFLRACLPKNEILAFAFNFFDKDHSGFIKVEQIKIYFVNQNVSENVFSKIFEEIDTNGDGKIDYSEFKNMMMNY